MLFSFSLDSGSFSQSLELFFILSNLLSLCSDESLQSFDLIKSSLFLIGPLLSLVPVLLLLLKHKLLNPGLLSFKLLLPVNLSFLVFHFLHSSLLGLFIVDSLKSILLLLSLCKSEQSDPLSFVVCITELLLSSRLLSLSSSFLLIVLQLLQLLVLEVLVVIDDFLDHVDVWMSLWVLHLEVLLKGWDIVPLLVLQEQSHVYHHQS